MNFDSKIKQVKLEQGSIQQVKLVFDSIIPYAELKQLFVWVTNIFQGALINKMDVEEREREQNSKINKFLIFN